MGILGKTVWGATKAVTKYVVVPIAYTAFLGYAMQEAADKIRGEDHEEGQEGGGSDEQAAQSSSQSSESSLDEDLKPAP